MEDACQNKRKINIFSKINLTLINMVELALTKMSSKGQIVIPSEMRKGIKEGESLIIIKSNNQFILKRASELDLQFKEDLEFAKRTEKAWKEYRLGKSKKMSFDDFLAEAKKW